MPPRKRPEHVCPSDHAHGENSTCRSLHGCSCDDCREGAARSQRRRYWAQKTRTPLLVDATGTHRRIRALQRLGWSQSMIAAHAQHSESWVGAILRNQKVTPHTANKIDVIFRELQLRVPKPRTRHEKAAVTKTRRYAERMGWPSPLAYDDIDDITERPKGIAA